MLQARDRGELLRGEADYQLHWLYLWYEQKPERALALLRGLDARYPSNPVFLQRIAEVQHEYFHDRAASAAAWEELLSRAARQVGERVLAETRARLGLADALIATGKADRALHILTPVLVADRQRRTRHTRSRICSPARRTIVSARATTHAPRTSQRSRRAGARFDDVRERAPASRSEEFFDKSRFCA